MSSNTSQERSYLRQFIFTLFFNPATGMLLLVLSAMWAWGEEKGWSLPSQVAFLVAYGLVAAVVIWFTADYITVMETKNRQLEGQLRLQEEAWWEIRTLLVHAGVPVSALTLENGKPNPVWYPLGIGHMLADILEMLPEEKVQKIAAAKDRFMIKRGFSTRVGRHVADTAILEQVRGRLEELVNYFSVERQLREPEKFNKFLLAVRNYVAALGQFSYNGTQRRDMTTLLVELEKVAPAKGGELSS